MSDATPTLAGIDAPAAASAAGLEYGSISHSDLAEPGGLLQKRAWILCVSASSLSAAMGLLSLIGWLGDFSLLRDWSHHLHIGMNPLTAICLIVLSGALFLLIERAPADAAQAAVDALRGAKGRRIAARVLAAIVMSIAAMRLLAYSFNSNVEIDRLLFTNRLGSNRIAPNSAMALFALGLALITIDLPLARRYWVSRVSIFAATAISMLSLCGYILNALQLFQVAAFTPMAINTTCALTSLCVAALCLRPSREPVAILLAQSAGGSMARRLFPAAILVPLLLAWLRLRGEQHGYFGLEFGTSTYTLCIIGSFCLMIWGTARRVHRLDMVRKTILGELRRRNASLHSAFVSEQRSADALRNAQSHLVQNEKLASLGQMVAGIAHEINNPLSFVANNVRVTERDAESLLWLLKLYQSADPLIAERNPELAGRIADVEKRIDLSYTSSNLKEVASRSKEGLKRIQQIVKDLRDFARLDQGDAQLVDLAEGFELTTHIVQAHAKRAGVALQADLAPLPPTWCNAAKINQVVLNLLTNAIDACSADAGKVRLRTGSEDGQIFIEVTDNGSGIAPDILQRIFDPFFTTKPPGQGTGLGLSISYGIVQEHGGRIAVTSTVGTGSTFRVELPLRGEEVAASSAS